MVVVRGRESTQDGLMELRAPQQLSPPVILKLLPSLAKLTWLLSVIVGNQTSGSITLSVMPPQATSIASSTGEFATSGSFSLCIPGIIIFFVIQKVIDCYQELDNILDPLS